MNWVRAINRAARRHAGRRGGHAQQGRRTNAGEARAATPDRSAGEGGRP